MAESKTVMPTWIIFDIEDITGATGSTLMEAEGLDSRNVSMSIS